MSCASCQEPILLSSLRSAVCAGCAEPCHGSCLDLVDKHKFCKPCAASQFEPRFTTPLSTTGTKQLSKTMQVTLRGIEHFFSFLGLKEKAKPEDYRRDREQAVFNVYKKALSISTKQAVTSVEVTFEGVDLTFFVPPTLAYDQEGKVSFLLCWHGGAFTMGSHDTPALVKMLLRLAEATGVIAVSCGYRKAPENLFPSWLEDAEHALRYVLTESDLLDALPPCEKNIILMGDSAGGNIAAALAHANRDKIHAVLLLYPILNLAEFDSESWIELGRKEKHLLLTRAMAKEQCRNLFQREEDARLVGASPLLETNWNGLPKTHILVGAFDPLHDDSIAYLAKHPSCTCTVYNSAPHGWISFPSPSPEQEEALLEMEAWIIKSKE